MKALVTGASSGIGKDIAFYLDKLGYELILVARDKKALDEVKSKCKNARVYVCDLAVEENVFKLYEDNKNENIDLLVNNAGFGLFGFFTETDLDTELKMINVNVKAMHILCKLFVKDMISVNQGMILNVASSSGFFAGPYLNTYYATKNYVLKLTMAINEELKKLNSKVKIGALCPGPVDTNFNKVAGGGFNTKSLSSEYVAKYAVDKILKGKMIIVPSFKMKLLIFLSRFMPHRVLLKILYKIQNKKMTG